MHRRRTLVSIATLATGIQFAGCLGNSTGQQSDLDVTLEAEVVQSFDDEHPARLRLTFTNQTDALVRLSPGTMHGVPGPITAVSGARRVLTG